MGSTAISAQLDAEEWRDRVGAYLDAASTAVVEMGGHVAKKLGDGLMSLFGYPVAQENDSERAVRAALSIQRALGELNRENDSSAKPTLTARLPGFDEFVDDALCFAEDAKIRCFIEMRARCDGGPSNNDRLSPRMAKIDNIERVALLRQHAAGEDQIGPLQVVVT